MKIRLCTPYSDNLKVIKPCYQHFKDVSESRTRWAWDYGGYTFVYEPRHCGPNMAFNRNSFLTDYEDEFPKEDFDVFFFIDSDIEFLPSDIFKIVEWFETYPDSVISATYLKRKSEENSTAVMWKDPINNPGLAIHNFKIYEMGFKPVHANGAGMMAIPRVALLKMEPPYFRHVMYLQENGYKRETAEDYGFCINAANSGIKIFCDFDVKVKHKPTKAKQIDYSLI